MQQMDKSSSNNADLEQGTVLIQMPNETDRKAHIASILSKIDAQFRPAARKPSFEECADLLAVGLWAERRETD